MDPISYFQAIVLGLLQGISELFPISSLGHSVVLPRVFGWDIHQDDDYFLSFLVATHCATALVLLLFFLKDWVRIVKGLGRSLRDRYIDPDDTDAKLGWLLVVGTIPAGLLGLALEHPLRTLFASTQTAAIFLFVNGLMLFGAEALRRRAPVRSEVEHPLRRDHRPEPQLPPGARRGRGTGSRADPGSVALRGQHGGRLGLGALQRGGGPLRLPARHPDHRRRRPAQAAGAAGFPRATTFAGQALVGALGAAVTAYFSVKFLLRFFETNRLTPFAVDCCVVGAVLSIAFALS